MPPTDPRPNGYTGWVQLFSSLDQGESVSLVYIAEDSRHLTAFITQPISGSGSPSDPQRALQQHAIQLQLTKCESFKKRSEVCWETCFRGRGKN